MQLLKNADIKKNTKNEYNVNAAQKEEYIKKTVFQQKLEQVLEFLGINCMCVL